MMPTMAVMIIVFVVWRGPTIVRSVSRNFSRRNSLSVPGAASRIDFV